MSGLYKDSYKFDGYDCIDISIANVLNNMKADHQLMFADSWGFKYDKHKDLPTLGKKINGNRGDRFKMLAEFHKIGYEQYINEDISDRDFNKLQASNYQFISQELGSKLIKEYMTSSRMILLEIDVFNCHWDKGYQLFHGRHACLVDNVSKDSIEVTDIWHGGSKQEISYEDFQQGFQRISTFSVDNYISQNDDFRFVYDYIFRKNADSLTVDIEAFAKDILEIDIMREFDGCTANTFFYSTLDSRLKRIVEGRLQFSHFIKFTNDKKYEVLVELFRKLADDWFQVRASFVKAFINKGNTQKKLEKISERVIGICEIESRILEGFKL